MHIRLQRVTSGSRWVPEIDGLRFLAIALVLVVHVFAEMINRAPAMAQVHVAHPWLTGTIYGFNRGVSLFFAISGYILAAPFVRQHLRGGKPVDLRFFYLRRLTRLEPPYLISLLLYAVVALLFRGLSLRTTGLSLLSSVFYVHNLVGERLPSLNFVTWSLEVEVQFYLLAPLLAAVFRPRSALVRRGLILCGLAASALLPTESLAAKGFLFPGQLCFFLVGYLAADLQLADRETWRSRSWDVAALLGFFPWLLFEVPVRGRAAVLLLCGALLIGLCAARLGPLTQRVLSIRFVALTGGMCYSLYLLHMLVISFFFRATRHLLAPGAVVPSLLLQLLLLLPAVWLVSALYFVAIERPCMDPAWPRQLVSHLRSRGGQMAATE